jgi:alpha-galactosidase
LKLAGLNENSFYRLAGTDQIYSAKELMNRGITLEPEFSGVYPPVTDRVKCTAGKDFGDFTSYLYIFAEEKIQD